MAYSTRPSVVVTGIGLVSPVGLSRETSWIGIVNGMSGSRPISRFDASGYETTFAAEVVNFDPIAIVGRKDARRMDRFTQFAVAAGIEAVEHANLVVDESTPSRVGVLIGTGMGGMETMEQGAEAMLRHGPRRMSPFFVPMMLPNMASGSVAIHLGAKGPNFAPTSACASSAHAIGEGVAMLQNEVADVMLVGGAEAPITRLGVGGFNAMGALSTRNSDPATASRPFDAERDGFVLGEGAAVLVLEREEDARQRGARLLGRISGYAATDDANHMVQPAPEGEGAARAIATALENARLEPVDISYVNAHGTSTQLNEKLETIALKRALGDHAYSTPISSTKSMTGHLLGAAGAVEAAFCLLAMRDGCLPPTINQQTPDPHCDLDYIPNHARLGTVKHALSCSMGFGGHNVAIVFSSCDGT